MNFYFGFVVLFSLLSFHSSFAQGGHVGGGGDSRRLYADRALIVIGLNIEYFSYAHPGGHCNIVLDPDFNVFLATGFYNVVAKTSLEWTERESPKCAQAIQGPNGIKVSLSYLSCPVESSIADMQNFILKAILEGSGNAARVESLWNAYANGVAQMHKCFKQTQEQ